MAHHWFPVPSDTERIEVIPPSSLSAATLYTLLTAPDRQEWKNKVGVTSPADGSAKVTTRLLCSGGWVFKTDESHRGKEAEEIRNRHRKLRKLAQDIPVWHPDKTWFLLIVDEWYWPVTACPLLSTLRSLPSPSARLDYWLRCLGWALELSALHNLGLDLNPANFALDPAQPHRIYYIDDETYPALTLQDVAEAIVGRIPEEQEVSTADWYQWGMSLREQLAPYLATKADLLHLLEGVRHYPLAPIFRPQHQALVNGLNKSRYWSPPRSIPSGPPNRNPRTTRSQQKPVVQTQHPSQSSSSSDPKVGKKSTNRGSSAKARSNSAIVSTPKLTCIFSDIHGNLPAFQAVLHFAREVGVDSFIFLGDVVGYGPFPKECIEILAGMKNAILLRGNHDQMVGCGQLDDGVNRLAREALLWTIDRLSAPERSWLLNLPLEYKTSSWLAVHGAPSDPHRMYAYVYELTYKQNLEYLQEQHLQLCFYGHSHVQFIYRRIEGEPDQKLAPRSLSLFRKGQVVLVNPGAVGQPRDGDPRAAFALWDRTNNLLTFHRVEYPIRQTMEALQVAGLPDDLRWRLEIGR
jgi:predicted phosphodiesterase